MLARISSWCFDHRWAALGLWLIALFGIGAAAGAVGPAYDGSFDIPDSDSADGFEVLSEHFGDLGAGGLSGTIVFQAEQGVDDPEVMAAMETLFAQVNAGFPDENGEPEHPGATVISPYSPQGQGQIAFQGPLAGKLAFAQVNLAIDVDQTESSFIGVAIEENAPEIDGLTVLPGGAALGEFEPPETELIGLAFAVVVLIVSFGSVMAMGLPIGVALGGVGAGISAIVLLSNDLTIPDFAPTLGAMIGLGVGIDYALFIVTRYREGTAAGLTARDATIQAMDTAGRAVIFAGITVVISLLGMLLMGLRFISGLGIGASVTVLMTMISSVTLLPALLGLFHSRVEITRYRGLVMAGFVALAFLGLGIGQPLVSLVAVGLALLTLLASFAIKPLRREVPRRKARPMRETFAYRWSRTIQRNPWLWLIGGTAFLLFLASPILGLRLGFSDEGNFPEDTYTRQAYDLLAEGFGEGFNGPFLITVVPGEGDAPESVMALNQALASADGVAAVTPPIPNDPEAPDAFIMNLVPTTSPQAEETAELVTTLRDEIVPAATAGTNLDVKVTGMAAANIDFTDFLSRRVLIFFGAVLALSFVLLMMVFRSLLVPVKAVIMNVISIAAAYGVVVAVFQWGWGGQLLGIAGAPIEPFVPMMLFAIVFGLSMDYEVFLLSRVREEYVKTGDPRNSVADGLAATARVITAAAAIMVVVFGSFMFEDNRIIKLFGMGLALAVLLDATLVRMLLVPATMELLGSRNWWMPRWLDRILPQLNVEGTGYEPQDDVAVVGSPSFEGDSTEDGRNGTGADTPVTPDPTSPDTAPV